MSELEYRIKATLSEETRGELSRRLINTEGVAEVNIQPFEASDGTLVVVVPAAEATEDISTRVQAVLTEISGEDPLADLEGALSKEQNPDLPPDVRHYVVTEEPKKERKIPLSAALSTVIVSVILAVLITFSATITYTQKTPASAGVGEGTANAGKFNQLTLLDRLFRSITPGEVDDEAALNAVLKAYVAATGDEHAEYFTDEEYAAYEESNEGNMVGIGISIFEDVVNLGGFNYRAITIVNVYPDSPAEKAGVLPGDKIMYVGSGDEKKLVDDLGYEQALALLKGEEGTVVEFEVFRAPTEEQGAYDAFEFVPITATRQALDVLSVIYRVCSTDPTVGIIRVTGFEEKTAAQFSDAVDRLKAEGCTRFVFDLRYNLGGLLTSAVDILTYFTNVGDKLVSVKDKNGAEETIYVSDAVDKNGYLKTGSGNLTPDDIGKYRDLNFTVLVNQYSASAAELFTANIRDYQLGTVVGVKTYGKGSIQTFIKLKAYGYNGVLKITYGYYYPPCGEGYHGVGVEPHVVIEQSEEALKYNINFLPDSVDVQLQKAIEVLNAQT